MEDKIRRTSITCSLQYKVYPYREVIRGCGNMGEDETDKKITEPVKPKIISCLLEKELANTATIADYCGTGTIKGNKYKSTQQTRRAPNL